MTEARTFRDLDGATRRQLPAVSKRRRPERAEYASWVVELLEESPLCELDAPIRLVAPGWAGCRTYASGLHHLRKQGQGGPRRDRRNVRRACDPCNVWVEDHPDLAHEAGLVVRAGEPLPPLPPLPWGCESCVVCGEGFDCWSAWDNRHEHPDGVVHAPCCVSCEGGS